MEVVEKFVTKDLTIRVAAVVTTQVVDHLRSLQNTSPIATIALGRAVTGAILLSSQMKDHHRVGLHFRGDGPLGSIFAEANFEGKFRGCTGNPACGIEGNHILSVGKALGIGTLTVVQNQKHQKEPYRGTVSLVSGEIGDDIAFFLQQSFQTSSVVSLGVYLNEYGKVAASGGVIVELMPGTPEKTIEVLEKRVSSIKSLSKKILEGARPYDLAYEYLQDFEIVPLDFNRKIEFSCQCSEERVLRSLSLLTDQDLLEMIAKGEPGHVLCEFCGKEYHVQIPELQKILDKVKKRGMH